MANARTHSRLVAKWAWQVAFPQVGLSGIPSYRLFWGFPGGTIGKESACQCRRHKRHRFVAWIGKIPWGRKWQPTPVFLPGGVHGQRSLVGYSPWGCKESDTTKVTEHTQTHAQWGNQADFITVSVKKSKSAHVQGIKEMLKWIIKETKLFFFPAVGEGGGKLDLSQTGWNVHNYQLSAAPTA